MEGRGEREIRDPEEEKGKTLELHELRIYEKREGDR